MSSPVVLNGSVPSTALVELAARSTAMADDVEQALLLAAELGLSTPDPAGGGTLHRWEVLATLGAADLTVARVVEPQLDALAILNEAELAGIKVDLSAIGADAASTWGVFAAEGPGVRLTARLEASGWVLDGVKPWCSLAGRLSHALVTAHTPQGRGLFALSLRDNGITVDPGAWVARGLTNVPSGPITMRQAAAVPVGQEQWYLQRPGFAWGGIGVAAVWLGGAVGVARALFAAARSKPEEPLRVLQLGAVDTALSAAITVLTGSAAVIDRGGLTSAEASLLAARVRAVVAEAVDQTLTRVGHTLGPAPLALDAEHARRVADLQLYVRQHHAERDLLSLGSMLVGNEWSPW